MVGLFWGGHTLVPTILPSSRGVNPLVLFLWGERGVNPLVFTWWGRALWVPLPFCFKWGGHGLTPWSFFWGGGHSPAPTPAIFKVGLNPFFGGKGSTPWSFNLGVGVTSWCHPPPICKVAGTLILYPFWGDTPQHPHPSIF